ncbi:hypothetical protein MRX96_042197 [Rhipicephalus microplus]
MSVGPAGRRTGQQQGGAGPGGPGGRRRRRCSHDSDRGPMTSSAGGEDRAKHAAGGRQKAKQENELKTLTNRRPASGGLHSQPERLLTSRNESPLVSSRTGAS